MPEHPPAASQSSRPADRPVTVGLLVGGPGVDGDAAVHCGVRDYAVCLASGLRERGVAAQVLAPTTWQWRGAYSFLANLKAQQLDVLHLQYPSIGYRYSLLPHIMGRAGLARCFIVTLHEHSALPRVQRLANHLFRATADRLVLTTEYEADAFKASAGSPIIPIASNIPVAAEMRERRDRVLYFGQIRPAKGIESFLDLARLASASGEAIEFLLLGSAPPRWRDYEAGLRAAAPASVTWIADAPASEVARLMAESMAAYLPFADGAGLRRGSMIAALSNGLPVIAPFGASTTNELRALLYNAASAEAALAQLRAIRAAPGIARERAKAGRVLAARFDWANIVEQHVVLYGALLSPGPISNDTPNDAPARSTASVA